MKNLLTSFVLFGTRGIASILQLRMLDAHFGSQYSGLNALLNQIYLYVTLFELGLAAAAVSLLYEPIRYNNHERSSQLICALQRDTLLLTLAVSPLVYSILAVYAGHVHTSLGFGTVFGTLALTATSALCSLLSLAYQAYLNAAEKIFKVHLVFASSFVVKTGLGLGLALATNSYFWVPITNLGLSIFELLVLRLLFHVAFPGYRPTREKSAASDLRARAKFAFCHKISGLIYYQSDFVILSLAANLFAVNSYAKFQYLSLALLGLCGACFSSMTTYIARQQIGADLASRVSQYRSVSLACHVAACTFFLGYAFTAVDIVHLFYRSTVNIDTSSVALFAILLWLNVVKSVDETYIAAKGAFEVAVYLPILEPAVYVGIGIILVQHLGFKGILIAGIAVNVVFVLIAKTIVAAKAALQITAAQLAYIKLVNLCSALVFTIPLYFWYSYFHRLGCSSTTGLLACNCVAGMYMAVVCYLLLTCERWRTISTVGLPSIAIPEEVVQ